MTIPGTPPGSSAPGTPGILGTPGIARPAATPATHATMAMNPLAVRIIAEGGFPSAHSVAVAAFEPVFVPVPHFTDDRGWSLMNMLTGVLTTNGQVNFSIMYPNVIKAWHRHLKQTDFWIVLTGHLKVGIHRESDGRSWLAVLGEKRPGVLIIPPTLWHGGATVGSEPAGLLYYVTHAYDPKAPDELRRPYDSITGFPWGTRHG
jgi:dTDP-4-dehydrorhamnose 3,5-epimerase